jgi:hypothetical protein
LWGRAPRGRYVQNSKASPLRSGNGSLLTPSRVNQVSENFALDRKSHEFKNRAIERSKANVASRSPISSTPTLDNAQKESASAICGCGGDGGAFVPLEAASLLEIILRRDLESENGGGGGGCCCCCCCCCLYQVKSSDVSRGSSCYEPRMLHSIHAHPSSPPPAPILLLSASLDEPPPEQVANDAGRGQISKCRTSRS